MGYAPDWDWPYVPGQEVALHLNVSEPTTPPKREPAGALFMSYKELQDKMIDISLRINIQWAAKKYLERQNEVEWRDDQQRKADDRIGKILVQQIFEIDGIDYALEMMRVSDVRI
jgi:hypothetical protein